MPDPHIEIALADAASTVAERHRAHVALGTIVELREVADGGVSVMVYVTAWPRLASAFDIRPAAAAHLLKTAATRALEGVA